jgi:fibronectin-binding autotransporter adhesin
LPTAVQGNITSTGVLAAGSIASGFGAISTGNNITTTATLQGATINATTGFQVGGAATTGHYLRGNGTNYVDSALLAGDISGTLFTLHGSTGTNQSITSGSTLNILAGGSGNLTANAGATNTLTVDIISSPTFSGLVTDTSSTTGLALTGTPTANGISSLLQLGGPIAGGNSVANGGTYIGINAPAANSGSTADFLNFQLNGVSKLQVTNAGAVTAAGQLTVTSGGASITGAVSITGSSSFTTGSGAVTLGSLGAGIVQSNGSGVLNSSAVDRNSATLLTNNLNVSNGGTGTNTLTANGILFGNGTSAVQATSAAANSILATNGSNVPSLTQTIPSAVQDNITRTGAILSGSIASGFGSIFTGNSITTSTTIQGATVNATTGFQIGGAASSGHYLRGNGTNYVDSALLAGDISGTLFTLHGSTGTNQNLTSGSTLNILAGGSGNLTAVASATNTLTVDIVSNPSFGGLISDSSNTTGLALTGTPAASATSSLLQIGGTIAGGNSSLNGGTYLGINEPAGGAGSTADFLNFQANGVSKLKVTNGGLLNVATGYAVGGTSGAALDCSAGSQLLSSAIFSGGILTGASCASLGSLVTMQAAYTNSGSTNPQILLSSANGGLKIQDGATAVTGNLLQIASNGAGTIYLGVSATAVTIADALNINGAYTQSGSGSNTFTGQTSFTSGGTALLAGSTGQFQISGAGDVTSSATILLNSASAGNKLAITSTPSAATNSSLVQLGTIINSGAAGGTFIGVNAGATSTADFIDFQKNNAKEFTVAANGDTTVNGSLTVNNANSASPALSVSGVISASTGFAISGATTAGHYLRNNGTNYVDSAIQATDISGTLFTLAGSTGTSQNVAGGATVSILKGSSNNLTSVASATNTITLDIVSNPTFAGLITGQSNTTGLALTGTPAASATSSLLQVGSAITGGNSAVNGGTYYGLNAPNTGAGSAADFLNFQYNGSNKVKIDNTGALTLSGAITAPTSTNTINGLVVNSGALSAVTGYTQTSGGFSQSYSTGTSNSAHNISATNTNTSATASTVNGVNVNLIGATNSSGGTPNTLNGINLANVTTLTGNAFNGINIGTGYNNLITSANFGVTAAGAVTAVGVNSGAGLLQGSAGLSVTGAAVSLNASSNFATSINTGNSTGAVSIGNSLAGAIAIQSGSTIGLTAGTTFAVSATNLTVATSGVITIGGVGSADNTTYLCRNSSNQIATCSTTSTGSAFFQGGNSFGAAAVLGTNDANVLNLRTSGTNRVQIDTSGNLSFLQDSTIDINSGGATPTLGLGTANARVINLGNSNASTIATFTAGSYALKVNDGGVNVTSVTSAGADLTLGDGTNVVGRTIKVVQAASGNGAALTIQAGAGATGNTIGGNLLLQGGAKGSTGTTAGTVIIKANGTDGVAFQVQNSSGTAVMAVNTSTQIVSVGTGTANITSTGSGDLYVSGSAGVSGLVLIGTTTNGNSFDGTTHELTLSGTARHATVITLAPEYAGAVMTGSGSSNIGTMNSDYCSNTAALSLNTGICATSGDVHSYYSWTTNQATAQTYDIYVRYQVPSDFSAFAASNPISMYGWVTNATTNTDDVQLALYKGATACSTGTHIGTTSGQWTTNNLSGFSGGNFGSCTIAAGDIVTFKINVKAGASGDFARAGELSISYLSKY